MLGPFEAVIETRCGGSPGGQPPLLPCARMSVSCAGGGPGRRRAVFLSHGAAAGGGCMKVMYERVAGIDVHKDMVKVAVRVPGRQAGAPQNRNGGVPDVLGVSPPPR